MDIVVNPSLIKGNALAPSSKSLSVRAIVAAMLADGTSELFNLSECDDAVAAVRLAESFGAVVHHGQNVTWITGGFRYPALPLQCEESGLAARMMIPLASLFDKEVTINGKGTLLKRPVGNIAEPLASLGVRCNLDDGYLPVTVKGPLKGGRTKVDGSDSSQFVSGLLMSLPLVSGNSEIEVINLRSRPYIDLTVGILNMFGVTVTNMDYRHFFIVGSQRYKPAQISLEGDWSGGAFLFAAAAINGDLIIKGLDPQSWQSDRNILTALSSAGVKMSRLADSYRVTKSELSSFSFDATQCPDLFPPLVVLASAAKGISRIRGVGRLRHKESDRSLALQQEFEKLGIGIEIAGDEMIIHGGRIKGGITRSHGDHRIAMALTMAGLISERPVTVLDAGCVAKSWPLFYDDMKKLGANITVKP